MVEKRSVRRTLSDPSRHNASLNRVTFCPAPEGVATSEEQKRVRPLRGLRSRFELRLKSGLCTSRIPR